MAPNRCAVLFVILAHHTIAGSALRVALVNSVNFHWEVLAGFAGVLTREYGRDNVQLYTAAENHDFTECVKDIYDMSRSMRMPQAGAAIPAYDAVVFISPEYSLGIVEDFLNRTSVPVVLLVIHDAASFQVPRLLAASKTVKFTTLGPHGHKYLSKRTNATVEWMLPTKPCMATSDTPPASDCGFAIQGAFDWNRRNYPLAYEALTHAISQRPLEPRLSIRAVGHGSYSDLRVPSWLQSRVNASTNVRMSEFYDLISSCAAILPLMCQQHYFDRKISGSVITSLVTGVPMVADERIMSSYSFLKEDHVVPQVNESLSSAMIKTLGTDSSVKRKAIQALANQLRDEARDKLKRMLV